MIKIRKNISQLNTKLYTDNPELFYIILIFNWLEYFKKELVPETIEKTNNFGTTIILKKIKYKNWEINRLNFFIYQFNQLFEFRFPYLNKMNNCKLII